MLFDVLLMKCVISTLLVVATATGFGGEPIREGNDHREVVEEAYTTYIAERDKARARYRQRLAKVFSYADRAEVLLLSFVTEYKDFPLDLEIADETTKAEGENWYYVAPYDKYSRILKKKVLKEGDLKNLIQVAEELLGETNDRGGGAWCHYPVHGITFYRDDQVLFSTSLCYRCSNYFLEYPDDLGPPSWVGFTGKEIQEFLGSVMPIPQAEIDRFNKAHPKTKKQNPKDSR